MHIGTITLNLLPLLVSLLFEGRALTDITVPLRLLIPMMQAESLPIKDASLDVAVGTLVMCSVKDVEKALQEIRRVLKPGGRYLFIEVSQESFTHLR